MLAASLKARSKSLVTDRDFVQTITRSGRVFPDSGVGADLTVRSVSFMILPYQHVCCVSTESARKLAAVHGFPRSCSFEKGKGNKACVSLIRFMMLLVVFKYLLEDNQLAKLIVLTIIGEGILEIELRPQQYTTTVSTRNLTSIDWEKIVKRHWKFSRIKS